MNEWTCAFAKSPAMRATLRACFNEDRSNVTGFVCLPLRQYRMVNFIIGNAVAHLRPGRASGEHCDQKQCANPASQDWDTLGL